MFLNVKIIPASVLKDNDTDEQFPKNATLEQPNKEVADSDESGVNGEVI